MADAHNTTQGQAGTSATGQAHGWEVHSWIDPEHRSRYPQGCAEPGPTLQPPPAGPPQLQPYGHNPSSVVTVGSFGALALPSPRRRVQTESGGTTDVSVEPPPSTLSGFEVTAATAAETQRKEADMEAAATPVWEQGDDPGLTAMEALHVTAAVMMSLYDGVERKPTGDEVAAAMASIDETESCEVAMRETEAATTGQTHGQSADDDDGIDMTQSARLVFTAPSPEEPLATILFYLWFYIYL